ncbi:MAG: phosphoglycolate phosphatase [Betaproteobacteria bacterium]
MLISPADTPPPQSAHSPSAQPAQAAHAIQAVLFDLDGTLIDSAPDLAGTANDMRAARGLPPMPYAALRRMVGAGARGMMGVAFEVLPGHEAFEALRDEFFERYQKRLLQETRVFEAVSQVLQHLNQRGLPWGIVTNKSARFGQPVIEGLQLHTCSAVHIYGDTTPHAKPHPEPLLEAARRMKVDPQRCVYVGDDLRDIQAGQAAGMRTLAAAWGYLGAAAPIEEWGADAIVHQPGDILPWLSAA